MRILLGHDLLDSVFPPEKCSHLNVDLLINFSQLKSVSTP